MQPLPRPSRFFGTLLLVLVLVPLPAHAQQPPVYEVLMPFVYNHTLAGAVTIVASKDKILDLQAVGFSDIGAKQDMKADAMFWIASQNKPITSTALMMLVDEGKIKLDDPVEKYLPEFRGQMRVAEKGGDFLMLKKPAHPITVREILSHTSGLVGRSPLEDKLDSLSLRDGVLTYGLSPLQFEPGTKYEYCNPGINTAGRLIEVLSGMHYEEFLQKRLFDPLGMKDTTFWPNEEQTKRIAKSYKPNSSNDGLEETKIHYLTYPLSDKKRYPYPGGGLFSTAADIATFCQMILNGGELNGKRYVSKSSVRAMTSTQTGDLLNQGKHEGGYGLGWSTSKKSKGDDGPVIPGSCGHGGAYSTNMSIDPEHGIITVYMVQHAGFPRNEGGKVQNAFNEVAKRIGK